MDIERLISALVMVAIILGAVIFLPENLLLALVGFVVGISNWEFFRLRFSFLTTIFASLSLGFLIILIVSVELSYFLLLISICLWIILGIFTITFPYSKEFVQKSLLSWFSGITIHLSFWCSIFLIITRPDVIHFSNIESRSLLILIISISVLMDTLAYFGGRRFGKRKFLPNISPNKTIEGFLIAIVLVPIIYSALFSFNSNISIFILFSLFFITSLFSVLGDAVASLFKRVAGVKDASNLIPGHGGVFDRIDSHLAAVPIFTIFLWTMTGTGM